MSTNLVGERGTVTVRIRGPETPGEVAVRTSGGTRTLTAWATREIPRHALVVIYDARPGGVAVEEVNL